MPAAPAPIMTTLFLPSGGKAPCSEDVDISSPSKADFGNKSKDAISATETASIKQPEVDRKGIYRARGCREHLMNAHGGGGDVCCLAVGRAQNPMRTRAHDLLQGSPLHSQPYWLHRRVVTSRLKPVAALMRVTDN